MNPFGPYKKLLARWRKKRIDKANRWVKNHPVLGDSDFLTRQMTAGSPMPGTSHHYGDDKLEDIPFGNPFFDERPDPDNPFSRSAYISRKRRMERMAEAERLSRRRRHSNRPPPW